MKKRSLKCLLAITVCFVNSAQAMDLLKAWELALTNDPQYQGARYANQSKQENISIAKAKLLPNIRFSGALASNSTEQKFLESNRPNVDSNYTAKRYAFSISQPLLRLDSYYGFKSSELEADAAEKAFDAELQGLAIRVVEAYFDTLLAQEHFENIKSRTEFLQSSFVSAQKSFEHGTGTRTDIEDAKSQLDSAIADEIEARNMIAIAEQSLTALIGVSAPANTLSSLNSDKLSLNIQPLNSLQDWIKLAEEKSPQLSSLRYKIAAAESEIDRRRAGHYPTVDLVATKSFSSSDADNTIGNQYNTNSVGVQMSVPIYAGGAVDASVRQGVSDLEKVKSDLESTFKKLEVDITKYFTSAEQSISRIQSLEQALKSSKQALVGNEKGVKAGTRNIVDVLNAQQQVYSTQTKLTQSRHNYVKALLKLKATVGVVGYDDIKIVNSWLLNN